MHGLLHDVVCAAILEVLDLTGDVSTHHADDESAVAALPNTSASKVTQERAWDIKWVYLFLQGITMATTAMMLCGLNYGISK